MPTRSPQLPIWRDANRLLLEIEFRSPDGAQRNPGDVAQKNNTALDSVSLHPGYSVHPLGYSVPNEQRSRRDHMGLLRRLALGCRDNLGMHPTAIKTLLIILGLLGPAVALAQTCNSSIPASTPTSSFIISSNGTATDKQTGLMWKRCAEGQSWDGATCTGASDYYSWPGTLQRARAVNDAGGYAGHADWRLPNIKELRSLVEEKCYSPAINTAIFPATPALIFWSASANANDSSFAWYVNFNDGIVKGSAFNSDKLWVNHVRLVRGGQSFTLSNDPPVWDARTPAGPAVQLRWTASSGATSYEVYRNGAKIYPTTTTTYSGTTFRSETGMTAGRTYSFYILAKNSADTSLSNTITVGPMPSAPSTPSIDYISPNTLSQGNSYQDVIITGNNFTTSSWHQFSTDGGATWVPAQSAPLFNSANSMTVGVNNTIVRTVRLRACASYGSTACSGSATVTIQASVNAITPRLSKVLPNVIPKGTSTQNVTLTGTAFTAANRYQYSTNGSTWNWVPTVPTVNNSTAMTIAVNNTVLGTRYLRVCAAQGSNACSNSLPIAVHPAPTSIPSISLVTPATIQEGAGYQSVTITGSNFSPTAWHQFSSNGGSTWIWAEYAPTINGLSSMVVGVDDTSAGTILVRVCASFGSNVCSGYVAVSIRDTEQPAQDPQSTVDILNSKAIFITHGWNSDASGWVAEMAKAICFNLGIPKVQQFKAVNYQPNKNSAVTKTLMCQIDGWDVYIGDWSESAATIYPISAWANAVTLGMELGKSLSKELDTSIPKYQYIHFIAHSAGSNLIESAVTNLRGWVNSKVKMHATFLDPYDPYAEGLSKYGRNADWADNYVDRRGLDAHKVFSNDAFNVDVTPAGLIDNWGDCSYFDGDVRDICAHSRPYRFYGLSITGIGVEGAYRKNDQYALHDPIESFAERGYPLSMETGASLETLASVFPKGSKCVVGGSICYENELPPNMLTFIPGALEETLVNGVYATGNFVIDTTETVIDTAGILFNKIKLATTSLLSVFNQSMLRQASTTSTVDDPAYMSVQVMTSSPINVLRFNWAFDMAGEGLMKIFVNGELVHQIDQRYVMQASTETEEVYIGNEGEPLPPGTYEIGFRLDGFGDNPSEIELTRVELGLKTFVDTATHVVTPAVGTGGSVSPDAAQTVNGNTTASFTVTADYGYITNIAVGGTCPAGGWINNAWTTGAISSDCTVSFSFDPLDSDNDGIGDITDVDDDNDGVPDTTDAFSLDASESADTDGDGVGNNADNCLSVSNGNQQDRNGDAIGDACEEDDGFMILLPVIKKLLDERANGQ